MNKPTWNRMLNGLLGCITNMIKAIADRIGAALTPGKSPGVEPVPKPPPTSQPIEPVPESSVDPRPASPSFLSDIATAEQATPVPVPPAPPPNSDDPAYAGDPARFQEAKKAAERAAAAFATAAKARGAAVAGVISKWLSTQPFAMLQDLLNQPRERMPIFRPARRSGRPVTGSGQALLGWDLSTPAGASGEPVWG